MYASAENSTNFTGVLIKRQYKPGQKYIQLVFETAEGLRLSISRNLAMVRTLSVGRTYQVQGPEFALGDKVYIHEPVAKLIEATPGFFKRNLKYFIIAGIFLTASGTASALALTDHTPTKPNQPPAQKVITPIVTQTPTTPAPSTAAPAQAATPAATTTTHKTIKTSTSSASAATNTTPSSTTQTQPQSGGTPTGTDTGSDGSDGATPPPDNPPADPVTGDPVTIPPTDPVTGDTPSGT